MTEITPVSDKKYRLEFDNNGAIEIGDDDELKFKPSMMFQRSGERKGPNYFFKAVPRGDFDVNDPVEEKTGEIIDKVTIDDDSGDCAVHCYKKEAGVLGDKGKFEFSLILKNKPTPDLNPTFDVIYDIDFSDGVEFWKQLPYDEQIESGEDVAAGVVKRDERFGYDSEDNVLCSMPEEAINSFAVMAPGKVKLFQKLFHIPRPKAIDDDLTEQWCDLDIDTVAKTMTVKIPWTFLNSATYPIEIDPTFGYTTLGGSTHNFQGIIIGSKASPSVNIDVDTFWAGLNADWFFGEDVKMALYEDDGVNGTLQSPQSEEKDDGHGTTQFVSFDTTSGTVFANSAKDYLIAAWTGSSFSIQRDYNGSNVSRWYNATYNGWPSPIALSNSVYDYSTYAEGDESGVFYWGMEDNKTSTSAYRNNRYMSGQSPNKDGMVVKAIWFRSNASGTCAVALHTGGSSGSPPSGATQRTEDHNVSIVSGWNRIPVTNYNWPKNTFTWVNVVHGTATSAYYTTASGEAEDFDSSNGRYSVGTPSDEDETSQLPTTIGSGSFSDVWYNVLVEYEIVTGFGNKVHGVEPAKIGKVLGVEASKISKVLFG